MYLRGTDMLRVCGGREVGGRHRCSTGHGVEHGIVVGVVHVLRLHRIGQFGGPIG